MKQAIDQLLKGYELDTLDDYELALKEIVQQLALLGLWRAKFFLHAAFYGGTALRLFYGLDRFSEDLDFSLIETGERFDLSPYLAAIEQEIESFGFKFTAEMKKKNIPSQIESAFIKGNTRINLLIIEAGNNIIKGFNPEQKIKIKLEIDSIPPPGAQFEVKNLNAPIPFSVNIFSSPDLFAGKMHAVLCRQWKTRVKGRDFYDLVWFIQEKIPCRLNYLEEKMIQTGHWKRDETLNGSRMIELYEKKLETVDFEQAKRDVRPFIKDQGILSNWNKEFFKGLSREIELI